VDNETISLPSGHSRRRPGTSDADLSVSELFHRHQVELVRLALLMTGDLPAAEDIVQDVFERMHRRWASLRDQSNVLPYARAAVLNGCRSAYRRSAVARSKQPRLIADAHRLTDPASAYDDRAELMAALRSLPRRQREVLVLRYYLDLDSAEIATTLRIGTAAVRSTTSRGLAGLASALREE
jgi:RNA polymerase sigma-70 factor (sigma-E family)